ncbi:MAG: Holliday junction branch migration protein RuvA [Bryobacteraceae bacterium]|nr:Holliday junction branch migration protein RuvA [Bryobacteraceae bacterium]MDW8376546.1 Holliday junction branch migration protein RuvA [Bryobacterales bacterium]
MIGQLRGTLLEKQPNEAVVEVGGVGYQVTIPVSTFTQLPEPGSEVRLRIYTHVREDAMALFGFLTREEKQLFERLITVNGVGPKLAITVLSGLAVTDLVGAIRAGDVARLTRIPGVGKKTAERLVVELREKVELALGEKSGRSPEHPTTVFGPLEEDVLSALINLGCARPAAEAAVRQATATGAAQSFEQLFRKAMEFVR